MKHKTRDEHLFGPGPKRILALDGGGVRGALTLGFLKRMEDLLRARYGGDPDFRLCDYFDLIGGTSTGAIIAGALALGFNVDRLQTLYRELGDVIFQRPPWRLGVFGAKFSEEPLTRALAEQFGDVTLGSPEIRTGVAIMIKRVDTGSGWLVNNIPTGKFYGAPGAPGANCDYLLRKVVRASTAVPHYFEPERLEVAPGVEGAFVDGGAGTDANPALRMLMLATMKGYGLQWPFGAENLLLVSAGTGIWPIKKTADEVMAMPAVQVALHSLIGMIVDTDWLVQTMLQWMSDCPTRWTIDGEIGDLRDDRLCEAPLLSYVRYNHVLDAAQLKADFGLEVDEAEIAAMEAMDRPQSIPLLAQIGALAAEGQVREEHFPTVFDLT